LRKNNFIMERAHTPSNRVWHVSLFENSGGDDHLVLASLCVGESLAMGKKSLQWGEVPVVDPLPVTDVTRHIVGGVHVLLIRVCAPPMGRGVVSISSHDD